DEAMLFGGKANAMVLDNEEMKNTQGEFWPILVGLFVTGASWLNAPTINEHTHPGRVFSPHLISHLF
ncbi:hypothetical protein, partial [Helicobacter cappadocius]